EECEFHVVGSTEADPMNNIISDESPVGKSLLGKKIGEMAEAALPNGESARYEVLSISK
ncbi:MAG TPA: GreA/GreB family elongation factor, partial [Oscillospiraceae bacterium]|nr:GreA/GreB family elongation factor [Oscillospiraceae bacterium]